MHKPKLLSDLVENLEQAMYLYPKYRLDPVKDNYRIGFHIEQGWVFVSNLIPPLYFLLLDSDYWPSYKGFPFMEEGSPPKHLLHIDITKTLVFYGYDQDVIDSFQLGYGWASNKKNVKVAKAFEYGRELRIKHYNMNEKYRGKK